MKALNKILKGELEFIDLGLLLLRILPSYYMLVDHGWSKIINPENKLSVVINQNDNQGKLLYASQDGTKKELSNKNLIFSYIKHPLMTFKIIM